MSLPPQKEYESVNWHGENLEIDRDKKGFITISRPPFETVFNPAEGEEISQFIHEYRSRPAPSPKFTKNCMCDKYTNCTDCKAHDTAIRNATLDEVMTALDNQYYYQGMRDNYQRIIKSLRGET